MCCVVVWRFVNTSHRSSGHRQQKPYMKCLIRVLCLTFLPDGVIDWLVSMRQKNTEQYYGIDPNARLQQGYADQAALYNTGKFSRVLEGCAEDYNYGRIKSFDTIFTSPPYFIIERYTSETTQSWQRYKKLENWLEHFLFRTLEKASHTLISGAHLILNISDVYCNHTINKICDPMNDKISTLGHEYVGAIGLKFPKRPNSKAVGDGVFCEPIWVWRKL